MLVLEAIQILLDRSNTGSYLWYFNWLLCSAGHLQPLVQGQDPSQDHQFIINEPIVQGQDPSQGHPWVFIVEGGPALSRLHTAIEEVIGPDHR